MIQLHYMLSKVRILECKRFVTRLGQVAERIENRFAPPGIRIFDIVLATTMFFVVLHVPTLIGNLLLGTALISQIAIPVTRGFVTLSKEEREADEKAART